MSFMLTYDITAYFLNTGNSLIFLHQSLKMIFNQFFPQCKQLLVDRSQCQIDCWRN